MFVYSITNQTNNKKYIGISLIPLDVRKQYHTNHAEQISTLLNSTANSTLHSIESLHKLTKAFIQFDMNQFTWEVLEKCETARELCKRQCYYITLYDSFNNGYNNIKGIEDITQFDLDDTPVDYVENAGKFTSEKVRGESNINVKLTFADVQQIKKLLSDRALSHAAIAKKFNVARSTITNINKGLTWTEDDYTSNSTITIRPDPIAKGKATGFTCEQVDNIHKHILSGQYTKKELMELLEISEHGLKKFTKQLKDAGHSIKFKKPNPSLTDEQAREIKLILKAGSMSQNEIAKQYGVSKTVIAAIRKGETYRHVAI